MGRVYAVLSVPTSGGEDVSGQRENCGGDCGSCSRCGDRLQQEQEEMEDQRAMKDYEEDMAERVAAVPRGVLYPALWAKAARYALAAAKLRLVFKREDASTRALVGASVKADEVGEKASNLFEESMGR
jgi:hypothetical protein